MISVEGDLYVVGADPGDSKLLGIDDGSHVLKRLTKLPFSSKVLHFSVGDKHAAAVDGIVS
jgi:hypothetical protein